MDYEALKAENEALILEDERELRAVPRGLPNWLGLHTTTACNLKCVFCLQADGLAPRVSMAVDVASLVVEQLFPTARVVQLTASGEPFMTPQLPKVLDCMADFQVKLDVNTNGTLLKDRSVLRMAAELADTFTFSIDGGTRETFNALRIGADLDQVMENIRFWNQLRLQRPFYERPRMTFQFILMKETIREVEAILDIAHAFRADLVTVCHLSEHRKEVEGHSLHHDRAASNHYLGRAREHAKQLGIHFGAPDDFPLSPEEADAAAGRSFDPPASADSDLLRLIHESIPPGIDPGGADIEGRWGDLPLADPPGGGKRCHYLWRRTYVSPDGQILTCCHPDAEFLGSIREHPFRSIWTGDRYAEYRTRVYSPCPVPICDNCFIIGRSGRTAEMAGL